MTVSPEFPARLRQIRESNGLTQEKIAELLDVEARWIQELESGRKSPGEKLMNRICDMFPEIQQQQ